jgi:glycerol-3-phosphate dehydrogenase
MLRVLRRPRNAVLLAGTTAGVGTLYYSLSSSSSPSSVELRDESKRYTPPPAWTPPSRKDVIERLKLSSKDADQVFDLLVIGGGATGAGVALDAASRGLKVALVEKNDFSSGEFARCFYERAKATSQSHCFAGTSSKSTKLVHGGVRYLQKAIFELDYEQYKLVKEALHERKTFLHTAPYLSIMQPIMLPVYKWVGK